MKVFLTEFGDPYPEPCEVKTEDGQEVEWWWFDWAYGLCAVLDEEKEQWDAHTNIPGLFYSAITLKDFVEYMPDAVSSFIWDTDEATEFLVSSVPEGWDEDEWRKVQQSFLLPDNPRCLTEYLSQDETAIPTRWTWFDGALYVEAKWDVENKIYYSDTNIKGLFVKAKTLRELFDIVRDVRYYFIWDTPEYRATQDPDNYEEDE